jgi:hypothetical protein
MQAYLSLGMAWMRRPFHDDDPSSGPDPFDNPQVADQWLFQPHCRICFALGSNSDTVLTPCKRCRGVAHCASADCTTAFADAHTPVACERYCVGWAALVMACQQETPLTVASRSRLDVFKIPSGWAEYLHRKIDDFPVEPALLQMPPVMAMLTDGLSLALTILHGLTLAYTAEELTALTSVNLVLMGASIVELVGVRHKYEEILHWLPNVTSVNIALVGPSMNDQYVC